MEAIIKLAPCMTRISWIARGFASRSHKGALPDELIVSMDREMIACWHPEKTFPYKYSLPIPNETDTTKQNEFLRVGQKDVQKVFHKELDDNLLAQELGKMTYTTKHRWFPKKRRLRAKKTEPDRPYL